MKFIKLFSLLLMTLPIAAEAASFTYEAQLIKPDGNPVTGTTTEVRIQIRTPNANSCLLYEEQQTKNLSATAGYFNFKVNDGTGTRLDSSGYSFDQIFSNLSVLTVLSTFCVSGAGSVNYSPAPQDGRAIKVLFRDETMGGVWEDFPLENIGHVPYALQASFVGGFPASSILRVDNGGTPGTASAFTPANFTELVSLIAGSSTKYITKDATNGATVPSFASAPSSPVAGSFWYDSTSNVLKYYTGSTTQTISTGGGGGITSLNGQTQATQTLATPGTAGTAPTWSSGTGTHTLNIPMASSTSVTAGLISKADFDNFNTKLSNTLSSGQLWIGNGSNIATPVTPSGDATISLTGVITLGNNVAMLNGRPAGQLIAGGTASAENLTLDSTTNATKGSVILQPSSGNVGIGVVSPGTRLDVNGSITARPAGTSPGQGGSIALRELAANGTNTVRLIAPDALSTDVNLMLPVDDGNAGQVLSTDGNGILSWANMPNFATSVLANNGTAGAPSISFNSDSDTGFYNVSAGQMTFSSDGSAAFHLNASGITSVNNGGAIVGATPGGAAFPTYSFAGDPNTGIFSPGADILSFTTAGAERLRIDSSGNVGLGTTSAGGKLEVIQNTTSNNVIFGTYSATQANASILTLLRGRGASTSPANAQTGDLIGAIAAAPFLSGANYGAKMTFTLTDPAPSSTTLGTTIGFHTAAQGTGAVAQRMVITDGGNVGIGTSVPIYTLDVFGDISANNCVKASGTTLGGTCMSDERLKTEIHDFDLGLEALASIQPRFFKFNGLGDLPTSKDYELGVVAQEVEKSAPELIMKKSIKLHKEDQETTEVKQVNYSAFTYVLINAVKELHHENQELKQRLERLEKIVSAQSKPN